MTAVRFNGLMNFLPRLLVALTFLFGLDFQGALSADVETSDIGDNYPKPDTTWLSNAGFGIFLHWGAYSQTGGRWNGLERNEDLWGEWLKKRAGVSHSDYEALARTFNPSEFNPQQWAAVFKDSGAQYVVLTSKHHEGFAMYHSKVSPFNSYDWPTSYHGDPVKELGDAVRDAGLKFGVYYSQNYDWYHMTSETDKKTDAEFAQYFNTISAPQVQELTTGYGPLSVIWFDMGMPNQVMAEKLKAIVRRNQPQAIINSRLGIAGDYNGGGDNEVPIAREPSPWESCMTLTQHWATYPQDVSQRSAHEVIQLLADIRSKGGNLLLDIGPDSTGRLAPRDVAVLREVGKWLSQYGQSIYGVRASPLTPVPWGGITSKGDLLYLHIFDMPSKGDVLVPGIKGQIEGAWMLGDPNKTPLPVTNDSDEDYRVGLNIDSIPASAIDEDDMVAVVKLAPGATFDTVPLLDDDLTNILHPGLASLSGGATYEHLRMVYSQVDEPGVERNRYDERAYLDGPESALSWTFRTIHDGDYHIVVHYQWRDTTPGQLKVTVDGKTFAADVAKTQGPLAGTNEHPYVEVRMGTVAFRAAGSHTLSIASTVRAVDLDKNPESGVVINQIDLVPTRVTPLASSVDVKGKSL